MTTLDERFTLLDVESRLNRACDRFLHLNRKYEEVKARLRMAKVRGRLVLVEMLRIRKHCLKEMQMAFTIYIFIYTARYLELLRADEEVVARIRARIPTIRDVTVPTQVRDVRDPGRL